MKTSRLSAATALAAPADRTGRRAALRRVGGYLRSVIQAIANSKLRRMERELELRGIYRDPAEDSWMRKSQSTERS